MSLNKCCFCIPLRTGVTVIAVCSSIFYIGCLIWLLKSTSTLNSFSQQDQSAAKAVFWTCVSVIGLYSASSLFGVIGGITQNRKMVNIFRYLYWIVAVLLLLGSSTTWILMMVKRDSIISGCQKYLLESTNASSYYSPVTLPNDTMHLHEEDCTSATKQILIIFGIIVFIGNAVQVYFACLINAYARRLKGGLAQHHKLRDMDDFPENKMGVY
ncbi:hypothetical protein K501DRAFT_227430 [Backusella circina FSU 941]|nr:hypothetical protein K501DRAFT_227430 [Backusella circina FSU 941]